jgi:phospholipid/cholesterol/gamma-HCH transport system permease protein
MSAEPSFSREETGDGARLRLVGRWTIEARGVEARANEITTSPSGVAVLDLSGVEAMDTAGAWLIDRARARLGPAARIEGARQEYAILLKEAAYRDFEKRVAPRTNPAIDFLAQIGRDVARGVGDLFNGVSFLGQIIVALTKALAQPWRLRAASIITHVETFGFNGVPIIALINFIVGCIVAQQGIYQLRRFGAATYAIDLIGILVLRELGVLLTSIMVAGRSGSAVTAELGSMKMREEIDALRVMGLDPLEVLVVPRVLALVICLPLLTFIGDMAALFGGLLVSWAYEGINPRAYSELLKEAIGLNTFVVGLVKAPFMALVIIMTASIEGFAVKGSAESLGQQVTASVVKSIFMIILLDGIFAIYFAAIHY